MFRKFRKLIVVLCLTFIIMVLQIVLINRASTQDVMERVAFSKEDIPLGGNVTAAQIEFKEMNVLEVDASYVTEREFVEGMYAETDIFSGEILSQHRLTEDMQVVVFEKNGENNRLVTLALTYEEANAWNFRVSDLVDVLYVPRNKEQPSITYQNIIIAGTLDENLVHKNDDEKNEREYVILETSDEQARSLLSSRSEGEIYILIKEQ